MKNIRNAVYLIALSAFILTISGCKTTGLMQCPDLASAKKPHAILLALGHHHSNQIKTSKPAEQASSTQLVQPAPASASAVAATDQDMHFKIKMPRSLDQNMQNNQDLADMNKLLANYSSGKVALQRNDNGKLFLKAHSIKDIFALAKKVYQPRGYYERRYGNGGGGEGAGGAAIASSILGPIGFVFAFIPFLSLAAIPISIAAIITGAIGLKSARQRRAAVGLTFGILGLILAILFSWLYFAFWAFFVL